MNKTRNELIINNALLRRAKGTIDFLDKDKFKSKLIADCGIDNPLKNIIEKEIKHKIRSLDFEFDYERIPGKYDIIFCFEILEHLFNPLFFLNNIKGCLEENGIIYLSTPRQFPQFLKAKHHYHEIETSRLMWLFEEAGLEIIKQGKVTIAGKWYNHIGIRPILRYFQKTRIYKLRVKKC